MKKIIFNFSFVFSFLLSLFVNTGLAADASSPDAATIRITADNQYKLYINGALVGSDTNWKTVESYPVNLKDGDIIAVEVIDTGGIAGLAMEIEKGGQTFSPNYLVQTSNTAGPEWQQADPAYNHASWSGATEMYSVGKGPWVPLSGLSSKTKWIYTSDAYNDNHSYFYFKYGSNALIKITADNQYELFINGQFIGSDSNWTNVESFQTNLKEGDILGVHAVDFGGISGIAGFLLEATRQDSSGNKQVVLSDSLWKISSSALSTSDWEVACSDISACTNSSTFGANGTTPWKEVKGISKSAQWTWASNNKDVNEIWARKAVPNATLNITADNACDIYLNGTLLAKKTTSWKTVQSIGLLLQSGDVLAIKGIDLGGKAGLLASLNYNGSTIVSGPEWKISKLAFTNLDWTKKDYLDNEWQASIPLGQNGISPWKTVSGIDSTAQWIWSADPYNDNTVYFRLKIGDNAVVQDVTTLNVNADNSMRLFINGAEKSLAAGSVWNISDILKLQLEPGDLIAVEASDTGYKAGFLLSATGAINFKSDTTWKYSTASEAGWNTKNYSDNLWKTAQSYGKYGTNPWSSNVQGFTDHDADWIWSDKNYSGTTNADPKVYFRKILTGMSARLFNTNTIDRVTNTSGIIQFNGDRHTNGFVNSLQAVEVKFFADQTGNKMINIHSENPDGNEGMIGVQDPSVTVPIHWAVYDEPIADGQNNNHSFSGNPLIEGQVLDINNPAILAAGTIVYDESGKTGNLANYPVNNGQGNNRQTSDGIVYVYFGVDYTDAPAQDYKMPTLVIDEVVDPIQ